MKKRYIAIILVVVLVCAYSVTLAIWKNGDYAEMKGYSEYLCDVDTGYEDVPYFAVGDDWCENKDARSYYKRNARRCGRYLITDYEDGVCINRYYNTLSFSSVVDIPETLDGKPVVKIGGYLFKEKLGDDIYYHEVGAFANILGCVLNIPPTVKYISRSSLYHDGGCVSDEERKKVTYIVNVNVNNSNPYYYSENGVLFTKNKKSLLFLGLGISDKYTVPDFVETFEPMDGASPYGEFIFGKNIKEINAIIYDIDGIDIKDYLNDEGLYYSDYDLIIKGYSDTVAEEWAEEYKMKFVSLD